MLQMRGSIRARLQKTNISNATTKTLVPFSTSSGGGRGRGGSFPAFSERAPGKPNSSDPKSDTPTDSPPLPPPGSGRGGSFSVRSRQFNFIGESKSDTTESSPVPPPGSGRGHGRGNPVPPPPGFSSFSPFIASIKQQPSAGRGRGRGVSVNSDTQQQPDYSGTKKPILFKREDDDDGDGVSPTPTTDFSTPKQSPTFTRLGDDDHASDNHINKFQGSIRGVLIGMGRGKTMTQSTDSDSSQVTQEENRHLRRRPPGAVDAASETTVRGRQQPILSRDDAVKNARKFLSREDNVEGGSGTTERGGGYRERGAFSRARGGRGRGRRGGFRGRGGADRGSRNQDTDSSHAVGLYVGDDADGEKFAKKVGPEIMNQVTQAFEEIIDNVLPSPIDDEHAEALDINYKIELEPEYAVEFDNPDIDEKEPIPLRDALEKVKPFLMQFEGIQSQEEWEEAIKETMAQVPLMKKIVDHYSGPDRVTAKKQQEELERVAKTLPSSVPSAVKKFTDRAVISLQSNPGWGFDKKCQFMDKLVMEVSQHYK